MDLSFKNDTSRSARFKRELRNPSMLTVFILFTVALIVVQETVATQREYYDLLGVSREASLDQITVSGAKLTTSHSRSSSRPPGVAKFPMNVPSDFLT